MKLKRLRLVLSWACMLLLDDARMSCGVSGPRGFVVGHRVFFLMCC